MTGVSRSPGRGSVTSGRVGFQKARVVSSPRRFPRGSGSSRFAPLLMIVEEQDLCHDQRSGGDALVAGFSAKEAIFSAPAAGALWRTTSTGAEAERRTLAAMLPRIQRGG